MLITQERTRIIFSEYTDLEKKKIENIVATEDKVFLYEDSDNNYISFPSGMLEIVKKTFPNIHIEDKSSTFWEYDNINPVEHQAEPRNQMQIDFIKFTMNCAKNKDKVGGILPPGAGKGNPISMKLPSPNGYKVMGDLCVGDRIFGSNGKPNIVEDIYELGERDIYKVTFNDGRYSLCTEDHLWNVFYEWTSTQKTVSLKDMLQDYKIYQKWIEEANERNEDNRDPYLYKYRIPLLSAPVEYDHKSIPLDPYTVGVFLGDGCCKERGLSLSSGDGIIPMIIAQIHGLIARGCSDHNYTYNFYRPEEYRLGKKERVQTSEFFASIPELIGSDSGNKKIPELYMYNDFDTRMELLRGLMDTDGSISSDDNRYHVRYSSSSKEMLLQVQELVRGLGFNASICNDNREEKYKNGYHGSLLFNIPHSIKRLFFSHPRKLNIANKAATLPKQRQQPYEYLIIKDIQLSHKEKARCIKVSAPDHLYLAEDFIVTHNTFMACYSAIKLSLRTLIIAPTTGVKAQWGETLTGMFKVPPERVKVISSPKDFINVKEDFIITTQASLGALNNKFDLEKIMKANKFGIKIIDEAHMFFHNTVKVDGSSNIAHNWYLTGTFGRSGDEENRLYHKMFGDIKIFNVPNKNATLFNRKPGDIYGAKPHMNVNMMWTKSGLSESDIKKVSSSMRYSERSGKWARYGISVPAWTNLVIPSDGEITPFLNTILKVIRIANTDVKYGRMLALGSTINSIELVAEHIKKMYPSAKVGVIHSKIPKEERDRIKKEADIIVSTTKSAGTGFDVKDLSKLVVWDQWKSWILSDQISGRLRRRPDEKDTYMWHIIDATVPQLRNWAKVNSDMYRRKSKLFKVIDI